MASETPVKLSSYIDISSILGCFDPRCPPFLHLPLSFGLMLRAGEGLVFLSVHQRLELLSTFLVNGHLADPAATMRVVLRNSIDLSRFLLKHQVDISHTASDRGVDVGCALHGLNSTNRVASLKCLVDFGEFHINNIAQLHGGVGGDADHTGSLICVEIDPFVVLGVLANLSCAVMLVSTPQELRPVGDAQNLEQDHSRGSNLLEELAENARVDDGCQLLRVTGARANLDRGAGLTARRHRATEAMMSSISDANSWGP
jgi:hypothetical protein